MHHLQVHLAPSGGHRLTLHTRPDSARSAPPVRKSGPFPSEQRPEPARCAGQTLVTSKASASTNHGGSRTPSKFQRRFLVRPETASVFIISIGAQVWAQHYLTRAAMLRRQDEHTYPTPNDVRHLGLCDHVPAGTGRFSPFRFKCHLHFQWRD